MTILRITHVPTGMLLAVGPTDRGITWFEGNYYVRRKYLCTERWRVNSVPGLCVYAFLYAGFDLWWAGRAQARRMGKKRRQSGLGFPSLAFRVAVPGNDPQIRIEPISPSAPVRGKP